jgi:hypothetical protein
MRRLLVVLGIDPRQRGLGCWRVELFAASPEATMVSVREQALTSVPEQAQGLDWDWDWVDTR